MKAHLNKDILAIIAMNITFFFSNVMIFPLLVVYVKTQYHFSDVHATTLFGAFGCFYFGAAIWSGALVDRFASRLTLPLSCLLVVLGFLCLSLNNMMLLYVSLGILCIGAGMFQSGMNLCMSHLYSRDDPHRDVGFTLSYIGINIGATIAAFSGGFLADHFGYHTTFLITCSGALISMVIFLAYYSKFDFRQHPLLTREPILWKQCFPLITFSFIGALLLSVLFFYANFTIRMVPILGVLIVIGLAWLGKKESREGRNKLWLLLALIVVATGFWLLYMTSPSFLTLFISTNVDRHVFGIEVPPSVFWGLGTFFIVVLGVIFSMIWQWLADRNRMPSEASKLSFSLLFVGVAYLLIAGLIHLAKGHMVSGYWLILCYLLQTCGELCIGPIGFAMVGKLAPKRLEATLIGLWLYGSGVGSALSGLFAQHLSIPTHANTVALSNPYYQHNFAILGSIPFVMGVVMLAMIFLFRKRLGKISA